MDTNRSISRGILAAILDFVIFRADTEVGQLVSPSNIDLHIKLYISTNFYACTKC